jgi:hypothetical protein
MRTRSLILGLVAMVSTASAAEMFPAPGTGSNTNNHASATGMTSTATALVSTKGLTNVNLKDAVPAAQKNSPADGAPATASQSQKAAGSPYSFRVGGTNQPSRVTDIKAELADAIARVKEIINRPVEGLPRKPGMSVATASPDWFRPGAAKPDFNKVDIRNTQEFPYEQFEYVTSDPNPNIVYSGPELEFNPMTKYFYTDRTTPKKKLNESEMLEINRLYRIIGQDEDRLAGAQINAVGQ